MKARHAIVALMTVSLAACSSADDDISSRTDVTPDSTIDDAVIRDVDVGGNEADIFPPGRVESDGEPAPVVIMLHGTLGDRTRMEPLAAAVAERGALVVVPSWPVIDQVAPFPESEGDEPYRQQSEAVICALRDVKQSAAEFGGDPSNVTLLGHSGGGMIGARVAIVEEPPWPGIDCDIEVDHRPDRFIGMAGDYEGEYQYASERTALYAPYDVLSLEPTNVDLDVWLLHGHNDDAVNVLSSALFADHLEAAGLEPHLLTTDTTHAAPLDPTIPAGRFAADRIDAIIHDRQEPEWWLDGPNDASLRLDADDSCTYDGPETWPTDRAMRIEIENGTDVDAFFAMVSIRDDVEITREEALAGDGILGVDNPDWVDWGGFRPVPPGEQRMLDFAFVEADQTFVAYCHLAPESDHPRAGWMFPAAVLSAGP